MFRFALISVSMVSWEFLVFCSSKGPGINFWVRDMCSFLGFSHRVSSPKCLCLCCFFSSEWLQWWMGAPPKWLKSQPCDPSRIYKGAQSPGRESAPKTAFRVVLGSWLGVFQRVLQGVLFGTFGALSVSIIVNPRLPQWPQISRNLFRGFSKLVSGRKYALTQPH